MFIVHPALETVLSVQEVVTHSLFGHTVKGDLEQFLTQSILTCSTLKVSFHTGAI